MKEETLAWNGFRITPAEGAKRDGVFEPFALVNRNDADGLFVALKALLILLRTRGVRVFDLFGKGFERTRHSKTVFHTHPVQELGEMKDVGEKPLPGWITEQPRANTLLQQQSSQHLDKPFLAPKL